MADNDKEFEEDWANDFDDGSDFSDDFEDLDAGAPKKKKKALPILGGAVVLMLAIGGYYGYSLMQSGNQNTMTAGQMSQTAPGEMAPPSADPSAVNIQSAPTDSAPSDLSAYEAENAGELIGDDAFGTDGSQDVFGNNGLPDDPYAGFDNPGTEGAETSAVEVPFNNDNSGEVVDIETLQVSDLTGEPDQMTAPTPDADTTEDEILNAFGMDSQDSTDTDAEVIPMERGPDATAAPVEPVEISRRNPPKDTTSNTSQMAATDTNASTMGMDNAGSAPEIQAQPAPQAAQTTNVDSAALAEVTAENEALESELSELRSEMARLTRQIDSLQTEVQNAKSEAAAAKRAASTSSTPATSTARTSSPAPTPRTVAEPPRPAPTTKWFLRAADENTAYISKTIAGELVTVRIGSMIPEYGVVQSITRTSDGWLITAENGTISQ